VAFNSFSDHFNGMRNYKYQAVPKPLGSRIQELMQSLQVTRDSLGAVRQGNLHQIIPVYGQLRALLNEKSKGKSPLLLDIAKEVGLSLDFYCMGGAGELPDELKKDLVLHLSGFPATLEQELANQRSISIEEFLDYKILIYDGRSYKTKDIISFFANKAGGAHYSPDLPQDFAQLLSFGLSGQPVLVNALLQIADLTYKLGVNLLKSQADFEAHLLILVPHQELKEPAYIFDNQYADARSRIFCRIEPGMKLSFGVTGIQGITAIAGVNRLIDWSKPHHFTLSLLIGNDLSTRLNIAMDGEEVSALNIPHPIFVVNDPLHYRSYQNRSDEDENAGLSFGLIEMAMYGRGLLLKEQAKLFLYFEEQLSKEDQRCVYFKKGQYGYAAPGTKDMQMTGAPVMWSVSKLLRNEFPENDAGSK
jgi:hypothetical protein